MAYKDLLKNIISSSDLTLREISRRAKLEGLSITPSYLSQLQNGKVPPPSDEISRIIAKVCNAGDTKELLLRGYLEKSPKEVKNLFVESIKQGAKLGDQLYDKLNIGKSQDGHTTNDFLDQVDKEMDSMNINDFTNMFSTLLNNSKNLYLSAYISDESMQPLIPKHAKVKYSAIEKDKIKDGDIVVVEPKDSEFKYFRSYYFKDNIHYFLPENREFPFFAAHTYDEFEIWGIVESYEVNIKK